MATANSSSTFKGEFDACRVERLEQIQWARTIFGMAMQTTASLTNENHHHHHHQIRHLYPTEIETLEKQNNKCSNWSNIRLLLLLGDGSFQSGNDDQSHQLQHLITNSRLDGFVVLVIRHVGIIQKQTGPYFVGIHDCSYLSNSIIDISTASVCNCTHIDRVVVDEGVKVVNCGTITHQEYDWDKVHVVVGPETAGGCPLHLTPESTMIHVGNQLVHPQTKNTDDETMKTKPSESSLNFSILSRNSVIRDTPLVDTVYLYAGAKIKAACKVEKSILYPDCEITNGSIVEKAALQWNACITNNSMVSNSLLMEHAHVGPHSVAVMESIIGPDVHISNGEVHCSVIGPNTAAHHQSLVISVIWAGGRGNVGYGANIGSNHTGRLPDQVVNASEGTFWGLSCVVTMPIDLSSAPYSIVAAGTHLSTGRCTMPFSLILNDKNRNVTVLPGWVLKSSPYTIERSENKFATRRKAKRHSDYTGWKIIRIQTIQQCVSARQELLNKTGGTTYGISDKARQAGIQTYTDSIQRFALAGLYDYLMKQSSHFTCGCRTVRPMNVTLIRRELLKSTSSAESDISKLHHSANGADLPWPIFPWEESKEAGETWQYQRLLLQKEFPALRESGSSTESVLSDLLKKYVDMEMYYGKLVKKCKARDFTRGVETVPGYRASHVMIDNDPVITQVQARFEQTRENVKQLVEELKLSIQPHTSKL